MERARREKVEERRERDETERGRETRQKEEERRGRERKRREWAGYEIRTTYYQQLHKNLLGYLGSCLDGITGRLGDSALISNTITLIKLSTECEDCFPDKKGGV